MRSIIVRTRDDDALRRGEARLAIQILVLITHATCRSTAGRIMRPLPVHVKTGITTRKHLPKCRRCPKPKPAGEAERREFNTAYRRDADRRSPADAETRRGGAPRARRRSEGGRRGPARQSQNA